MTMIEVIEVGILSGPKGDPGPPGPPGGGGGGGAPSGAAGGSLAGSYPNPTLNPVAVADLNVFTTALKGLAPASGGGTANFLRADGSWAAPPGGGGGAPTGAAGGSLAGTYPNPTLAATAVADLNLFTSALKGITPASGGGSVNFLRADGTWAVPANAGGPPTGTAGGALTGTYPNPTILAGAVGPTELALGAVNSTLKIGNNVVDNTKAQDMAAATIKGRVTAGTGDPQDLTGTQATTLLDIFTSALQGVAPASGGGAVNFLRADGTWAVPANAGGPPTGAAGGALSGTYPNPTLGSRLDQIPAPTASVNLNSQKIINLLDPTGLQDADTLNARNVAIAALPSLIASNTTKMPINTVVGPPAVTTIDVTQLVDLTSNQILDVKTLHGPIFTTYAGVGRGFTFRHEGETTSSNDLTTRSNMIEIDGNSALAANLAFCHNSGPPATPASSVNGAIFGRVTFRGYDGGNYTTAASASIFAAAEEAITPTNKGTKIGFSVCPIGASTALTESMKINAATAPNVVIRNALVLGAGSGMADVTSGYGLEVKAGALGYGVGVGGSVTQATSRTTATPAINKLSGAITLFSAAAAATWASFTVPNTLVASTDTVLLSVRGNNAANKYVAFVSSITAGTSFEITFMATAGTSTDTPIINFVIIKGVVT